MNKYSRTKDTMQIVNDQWRANHGNNEKINQAKKDFNFKMYNIKDKEDIRREIRKSNSISGQVERLNQKMNSSFPQNNNIKSGLSTNSFRNDFR